MKQCPICKAVVTPGASDCAKCGVVFDNDTAGTALGVARSTDSRSEPRRKRWGTYALLSSLAHRFFLDRPSIRERPFVRGAATGTLYGIGVLLDLIIFTILAGLFDLVFKQHDSGMMIFIFLFLSLPWAHLVAESANAFAAVAFGISVNIALLGLAWGVVAVVRARVRNSAT